MPKPQQPGQTFDLRVKSKLKDGQRLRVVEIQYVPTPDADARLSRAIDILLSSAARDTDWEQESPVTKKEPPRQAPAEDTLAGGAEEDRSCEEQ